MRNVQVGDIWVWTPEPDSMFSKEPEYYLISKQDEYADWFGILMNGEDAGREFEITVTTMENDWRKVA